MKKYRKAIIKDDKHGKRTVYVRGSLWEEAVKGFKHLEWVWNRKKHFVFDKEINCKVTRWYRLKDHKQINAIVGSILVMSIGMGFAAIYEKVEVEMNRHELKIK